jgi:uncharacterized UPF0160 family protein
MIKKVNKLITHNGSFHADDIFACATLCLMLEKRGEEFEIIRTRDPEIIKSGDYVFDVGGIYDEKSNRFDHHQTGGAGKRENNIEYSSCGLVWKRFGIDLCESQKIVDLVDEKLFAPIDAGDNGISIMENKFNISPYLIQNIFSSMSPTWREENINIDKVFLRCVTLAKEILSREIIYEKDADIAFQSVISIYNHTEDKRILVLDKNYPEEIFQNFPEILFVIYPRIDGVWGVRAVKDNSGTFKNRKNFPKLWAGLRDQEIAEISGVKDAIFCHRALFLSVANSKEGAIKLAQIAVESK